MRVFLSSTWLDLKPYREAVEKALRKMQETEFSGMEYFGSRPETSKEVCLAEVDSADVHIGIFAHRYGSIDPESGLSMTELEYRRAQKRGIPCLAYLMDQSVPVPPDADHIDFETERREKLAALKRAVMEQQVCFFTTPDDLATRVLADLHALIVKTRKAPPQEAAAETSVEAELEAPRQIYCAQLAARCQRLEFLGVLTPGEEHPIPLDEIFVELQVRRQAERFPERRRLEALEEEELEVPDEIRRRMPLLEERAESPPLPVQQTLRENRRLVLLGAPGSGKSTLTKYLALIFARGEAASRLNLPERRLPLLIPLRDYLAERSRRTGGDGFSFLDFLYANAEEVLCVELPRGFFEHYLRQGECLVAFDGMDEVTDLAERRMVRDAIHAFVNAYSPDNRTLITSRPYGYAEAPLPRDAYPHFTVLDFTEAEIEDFVTKWYRLRETSEKEASAKRDSLLATVKESPGVQRLAVNPLLLTIIALIHRQEAELPNQRVRLYDKATEVLLYSWERAKGLKWEIGVEEMRRRLEHIGFWMYQLYEEGTAEAGRAAVVEREALERELAHFLRDRLPDRTQAADEARHFLDRVQSRAGLLMEQGRALYSFAHLTFQEYFAAMDVYYRFQDQLDLDVVREVVLGHLHEPAWREVGLLVMSKLKPRPASRIVREVLEAENPYEDVLPLNLFLAAAVLADDVEVESGISDGILRETFGLFTGGPCWAVREDALQVLTALRGSRYASGAADRLLPLACGPSVYEGVRSDAAQALGQLRRADEAVVTGLLELARDRTLSSEVRSGATQALGQLGRADETIVTGLLELARDPSADAGVRRVAAKALGQLGRADEAADNGLLELARDPSVEDWVRRVAAQALGQLGRANEAAIAGLLELACDRAVDHLVRCDAAQALGQLNRADKAASILLELACDPSAEDWVRRVAAQALGQLGRDDETVVIGLLGLARDPSAEDWVRSGAAQALGQLGRADEAVVTGLLELARDPSADAGVCRVAAQALGQLGRADETVVTGLLELARDPSAEDWVRSEATQALSQLGRADEAAITGLLELAYDSSVEDWLRSGAAQALGQLGHADEAVSILLELVYDRASLSEMRSEAAQALGQLGRADEAVSILLELARDASVEDWVRSEAAQALGQLGHADEAVLTTLLGLAREQSAENWARSDAARALGQLGRADETVVTGLLELARNRALSSGVRSEAVRALGQLVRADEAVVTGLLDLARNRALSSGVRSEAVRALGQLGHADEAVVSVLLELARDPSVDEEMRSAAYRALKALVGGGEGGAE
jgi:predicted Zn-dependent protease/energy-coupling factor transporter ATP-binding protein EcfA2